MPIFLDDPNKDYSMLWLGDILLPSIILNYISNFDIAKSTGGKYHKVSIILYSLSLILAGTVL